VLTGCLCGGFGRVGPYVFCTGGDDIFSNIERRYCISAGARLDVCLGGVLIVTVGGWTVMGG
jgi:hypothetical protein